MAARSALDQFLSILSHYPPLSAEEEEAVAWSAVGGDPDARERLITHNMQFVVHVAKKYRGHGLSLEDLVCEGNVGLVRAADHYRPERKVRFISYAVWWIRQAILLALACQGEVLGLPPSRASDLYRLRKAERALRTELGRTPTDAEIGAHAALSADVVASLRAAHDAPVLELNADPGTGEHGSRQERLSLPDESVDLEFRLDARLRREAIAAQLTRLPKRDADVMRFYFGLAGGREFTLEEIAQLTGITRERVRQIRDRAKREIEAGLLQYDLALNTVA